jgi:hypothetical protein
LEIQVDNLRGVQALGWNAGQKEFVDTSITQFAIRHSFDLLRSSLAGDNQATGQGEVGHWCEPIRNGAHIKEVTLALCFRMFHACIIRMLQSCADFGVVE